MTYGYPMTRKAAEEFKYGTWAGNPSGYPFLKSQCAAECYDDFTRRFFQCSRKPGHGPDGLYCKQHAKKVLES